MLGFFIGFNSSLLEVGAYEKTKIISERNNWFLCFDVKPEWDHESNPSLCEHEKGLLYHDFQVLFLY